MLSFLSSVASCLTFVSISSLISLTFSIGFPLGSSIPQSFTLGMNKVGQNDLSIQPILTIFVESLIMSSVMSFDFWLPMFIPTSFITSIARGLISPDGFVPALRVAYPLGAYFLKKPSPIWLLPAFSTHTNRTFLSLWGSLSFFSLPMDSFIIRYYLLIELSTTARLTTWIRLFNKCYFTGDFLFL